MPHLQGIEQSYLTYIPNHRRLGLTLISPQDCDSSFKKTNPVTSTPNHSLLYCVHHTGWPFWFGRVVVWLMTLSSFRPPHRPPRPGDRQQPHRHHDHPVQQHWQRPVQSLHAGGSQWARVSAAEAQRRVGVHRPARHCQPHRRPLWENGLFVAPAPARIACLLGRRSDANSQQLFPGVRSSVLHLRVRLGVVEVSLQTLQPRPGRNLRKPQRGQRLPLHQWAGNQNSNNKKKSEPTLESRSRTGCSDALCVVFRLAITLPSLPVTQSQKTSLSGKVGAGWRSTARFFCWRESQVKFFNNFETLFGVRACSQIRDGRTSFGESQWRSSPLDWSM